MQALGVPERELFAALSQMVVCEHEIIGACCIAGHIPVETLAVKQKALCASELRATNIQQHTQHDVLVYDGRTGRAKLSLAMLPAGYMQALLPQGA